jgi:hypothetical protein
MQPERERPPHRDAVEAHLGAALEDRPLEHVLDRRGLEVRDGTPVVADLEPSEEHLRVLGSEHLHVALELNADLEAQEEFGAGLHLDVDLLREHDLAVLLRRAFRQLVAAGVHEHLAVPVVRGAGLEGVELLDRIDRVVDAGERLLLAAVGPGRGAPRRDVEGVAEVRGLRRGGVVVPAARGRGEQEGGEDEQGGAGRAGKFHVLLTGR